MNAPRILIVDDEPGVRLILEHTMQSEGYIVQTAVNGEDALQKITAANYDLILLDLHLGRIDGLQVLEAVHHIDETAVVIILTGYASMDSAIEALRMGAFDYLFKPAMPDVIRQRVKDGLAQRKQEQEREQILGQIDTLRQALNVVETKRATHSRQGADERFIKKGQLIIDRHHRTANLGTQLLELTTAEYGILLQLAEASPNPVSPQQMLAEALGYENHPMDAREKAKWYIHHLRRKIEEDPKYPKFIRTVRNRGYFWDASA